jgi:formyl-CoA transferase
MLAKADVFVQNLKPGAIAKLGFSVERLRKDFPRLIICSVSGYGEDGPYASRKAYDLLIQAEVGLASITGGPEGPSRVGVSVCDIGAGMNAYSAVLEALIARGRTGQGTSVSVSLFDAMADWMTAPLLQHEGGRTPARIGLSHTSISPYGVFKSQDGIDVLISIQNDREWRVLAERVLGDATLADHPDFNSTIKRVENRTKTDGHVARAFAKLPADALTRLLETADIAFARVSDLAALARHPHLRRISVETPSGPVSYPAPAARYESGPLRHGRVPAKGEHTERVRREFLG